MNLYLMQPCEDSAIDTGMAEWLRGMVGHVGVVICSSDKPSTVTATACAKALGSHVASTSVVGEWPEIERLAQQSADVLVVCESPNEALDGWDENIVGQTFCPGAVCFLDGSMGEWLMGWLVTPQIVLADKDVVEAARELVDSVEAARPSIQTIMAADKEMGII